MRAAVVLGVRIVLCVAGAVVPAAAQSLPDPYSGTWRIQNATAPGFTPYDVAFRTIPPFVGNDIAFGPLLFGSVDPSGRFGASAAVPLPGCTSGILGHFLGDRLVASWGALCPPAGIPEVQTWPTSGIRCECDDADSAAGDGCDARCQIEPCFTCTGPTCTPSPDGAACNDRDPCTEGETCAAGACGGGTAVAACLNLGGEWLERTQVPSLGIDSEAVVTITQVDAHLEYRPPARPLPVRLGLLDPQTGAMTVDRPTGGAMVCNAVEIAAGSASPDGNAYALSGTYFDADLTSCSGVPMTITATRCDGPCAPVTTTTTTTSTTTTTLPQLVAGRSLVLKDDANAAKRTLTLKASDAPLGLGLGDGSVDDPTVEGATVRVRAATFDVTYDLPASGWIRLGPAGSDAGYRYRDAALAAGPVRDVIVRPGRLLKIAGKGAGLAHTLAADPRPVDVVVALGARRTCLQFGGTVTWKPGRAYKATRAPRPAACAP